MSLGLYISVPFCRTKCSYCNFASDVFSKAVFQGYVDRVCSDLDHARQTAAAVGGQFEPAVDSIFLGGGTPTVLESGQLDALFTAVEKNFHLQPGAEITVECAPGTLTSDVLQALQRCGVNRVSLGVQSFVDQEAASVGRIHKAATVQDDMARLRAAGISNINVDLIAGLPHQTRESWDHSVHQAIIAGVPHVSVYMLEVDEDSRLGREVLAGGAKYHAHFVVDDDLIADLYLQACEKLNASGIDQYEISNFARPGFASTHNLKYWTRQPYMGFGVDAHSMLFAVGAKDQWGLSSCGVRFSAPDSLQAFLRGEELCPTPVSRRAAMEEAFFLGLRLNRGVDLAQVQGFFGPNSLAPFAPVIAELVSEGLIAQASGVIRLTSRGRLLSNEAFERFL